MKRFNCLFVFAGVLQVITSQDPQGFPQGPRGPPQFDNIPEKCRGPPQGVENPELCCQVEPMYTEEELAGCGFQKLGANEYQNRRGPPDCSKPICLMKTQGLLNENDEIKWPAVESRLKEWAGEGSFKAATDLAIEFCVQEGKVPGPSHVCEHARLMHCVGGVVFGNCPQDKWLETDSCKALKDHMEACKPQFQ